jgi:putative glutamine amidotransferase
MLRIASFVRKKDDHHFHRMLGPYPDVRLLNARVEPVALSTAHALLLTGGSDVSKPFLRQPVPDPSLIENDEPGRDEWDFAALEHATRARLPVFAICRGLQVLNVARGGTLTLHIDGHDDTDENLAHDLRFAPGVSSQIAAVNSSHHQAVNTLAAGLRVEAWCAADEIIEQVRGAGPDWVLAVQYHPERSETYRPLFDEFVAVVRQHARGGLPAAGKT